MPDWSIKIVQIPGGVQFIPDVPGGKAGDPLVVQEDDIVSWNNTTGQPHQPWPIEVTFNIGLDTSVGNVQSPVTLYLSDPIAPNQSSSPGFSVPVLPGTIHYCDLNNPQARGTITITAIPVTQNIPKPV